MLTPVPTRRPARIAAGGPSIPAQAALNPFVDAPSGESDPAAPPSARDIAASLRRATIRAHHALRDANATPETLRSLRGEIFRLEDAIDRLGLFKLRPFVGSLRRRIEGLL